MVLFLWDALCWGGCRVLEMVEERRVKRRYSGRHWIIWDMLFLGGSD